jgi:hypothetical protein
LWRKNSPRNLSNSLVADEQLDQEPKRILAIGGLLTASNRHESARAEGLTIRNLQPPFMADRYNPPLAPFPRYGECIEPFQAPFARANEPATQAPDVSRSLMQRIVRAFP